MCVSQISITSFLPAIRCVFQHAKALFVSFGTILRGDSTLNRIFVYLLLLITQP